MWRKPVTSLVIISEGFERVGPFARPTPKPLYASAGYRSAMSEPSPDVYERGKGLDAHNQVMREIRSR